MENYKILEYNSNMNLDNTDRKILNILQDNARMSNADLAEAINLSP